MYLANQIKLYMMFRITYVNFLIYILSFKYCQLSKLNAKPIPKKNKALDSREISNTFFAHTTQYNITLQGNEMMHHASERSCT